MEIYLPLLFYYRYPGLHMLNMLNFEFFCYLHIMSNNSILTHLSAYFLGIGTAALGAIAYEKYYKNRYIETKDTKSCQNQQQSPVQNQQQSPVQNQQQSLVQNQPEDGISALPELGPSVENAPNAETPSNAESKKKGDYFATDVPDYLEEEDQPLSPNKYVEENPVMLIAMMKESATNRYQKYVHKAT